MPPKIVQVSLTLIGDNLFQAIALDESGHAWTTKMYGDGTLKDGGWSAVSLAGMRY